MSIFRFSAWMSAKTLAPHGIHFYEDEVIERGRTNTALPTSGRPSADVGGRPAPAAGHGAGGEHQPSGVIHFRRENVVSSDRRNLNS